jgi:hypothetical protein
MALTEGLWNRCSGFFSFLISCWRPDIGPVSRLPRGIVAVGYQSQQTQDNRPAEDARQFSANRIDDAYW